MLENAGAGGDKAARQEILDSHCRVGQLLDRLEHLALPADLAPVLEECLRLLPTHFAREETPDGLFGIIGKRAPHARSEIEVLVGEHRHLLEDLGALTQRARERPDKPQLLTQAAQFTQRVRLHERRETKLLIDALARDVDGFRDP